MIDVLASYGLDGPDAFYAALEFWAALHGFVLLEMTGVMESGPPRWASWTPMRCSPIWFCGWPPVWVTAAGSPDLR